LSEGEIGALTACRQEHYIYISPFLFYLMLLRTHLAIGIGVALYFLPFVSNEWSFVPIVIFASLLPDAGSGFSLMGKRKIFKSAQLLTGGRGLLHTYTFCVGASLLLAFIFPVSALPFFVGYSFHLLADSFTKEGIRPFWPIKGISSGIVGTGGTTDKALFITFVIIDIILLITTFARLF